MIELSEQVGSYGIGMYSAMLGSGNDADLVERTAVGKIVKESYHISSIYIYIYIYYIPFTFFFFF